MTSDGIRRRYIEFFKRSPRSHKEIKPSPLVLEDDPTTLFTSSGMQKLVPYLKGEKKHPKGKRLVDSQPCFRTVDIEEVGDSSHTTFFEMLGNWSLGDYFKEDQLAWIWEFLTKKLNLPKEKLWVTVFKGTKEVPKDEESARIWKKIGISEDRIRYYGAKENWWSRSGPPEKMKTGNIGGLASEIFFEFTQVEHDNKFGEECHPNCQCGRFLEIGNSVFIQYKKEKNGSLKELSQKNVDFGGGLERLVAATENEPDIFKTDLLKPIMNEVVKNYFHGIFDESLEYPIGSKIFASQEEAGNFQRQTTKAVRVVTDHIRASVFIIKSGVLPSNKGENYILRRLLRRAVLKLEPLRSGILNQEPVQNLDKVVESVIKLYDKTYFDYEKDKEYITQTIDDELQKFGKTLREGLNLINKIDKMDGKTAFDLYQTYGFPLEITIELFAEKGQKVDKKEFEKEFEKHKKLSRTASAGMFKGGLADKSEDTLKLHTATHLLHWALRKVLGDQLRQEGSNITSKRLRFDFSHDKKLTEEEIKKVEDLINKKIKDDLSVTKTIEDKEKALKSGALAFFKEAYPEKVTVYSIGGVGKELCQGPHVESTGGVGRVRIDKQKKIGSNLIRIYAVLKE